MTLLNSSMLKADELSQFEVHQLYCGLDNCVTHESLTAELNLFKNNKNPRPQAEYIYGFERALQAPYMDVMMRGFAIDMAAREVACADLRDRVEHYKFRLDQMAGAIWDKGLNPRSNKMLREFFYDAMRFKEIITSKKGVRKVSLDRTALEKIYETYLYARPFVSHILSIRDLSRQLEVLSTDVDSDNRFRSSYNIAGTECISGDSLVWTKGGLRKIREIYETPHEVAVYNGSRFVIPVRKVMFFERDGKRIILEGGFKIECSLNHPLKTAQGFVKAKDLKAGTSIEINNGLPLLFGQHALPRGGIIEQMSEDFCELYGMLLADGSLNVNPTHKRARLANSDKRVRDRFLLLAKLVFNVEGKESGDEAWFSSVPVCTWLKQLGFPADEGLGTARYKYIPKELMRGKPNLIRALLRGLTLDTHITDKGLMFGTQSLEMREQIQQCLLILGIVSNKMQMGDSIKLNVSRAYCGRFISLIGFVQSQKLIKLATLIGERCQWHEPIQPMTKTFLRINQIEDWKGDVYDLTMPENSLPQYVAQGMTVHNTGRPSSSENAFGTGGNAQNIAPGLRHVFIADPGHQLVVIDFEQSEARDLGFMIGCLFGDWTYLDSCESGDLHTSNARLVWPELKWTGDAKKDKEIANTRFYRDFSYRDMAKRGGHLSNYMGTAFTMARHLKIPQKTAEEFQDRYCRGPSAAFPCIPQYWQWAIEQIQTSYKIVTPFGRERHFFGDPHDDATAREAIAFVPQSTTADRTNLGFWRTWKHVPSAQLLAQGYDSITFQVLDNDKMEDTIRHVAHLLETPLEDQTTGRIFQVPVECKVGHNWGYASKDNPDGLKHFPL